MNFTAVFCVPIRYAVIKAFRRMEASLIESLKRLRRYLGIPKVADEPGRSLDLDALRGLAILLVVLGHAITYTQPDFRAPVFTPVNFLAAFIYTFHVPLFCFVSGFVVFGRRISGRDKFLRLAVPFLAWIPVSYLVDCYAVRVQPGMHDMVQRALRGQLGLWYLWFLFLCCLTLIPVRWVEPRGRYSGEIALAVLVVFFIVVPLNIRGIPDLRNWFPFFALGYLVAKHKSLLKRFRPEAVYASLRGAGFLFLALFALLYQKVIHFYYVNGIRDIFANPQQYFWHVLLAVLGIAASVYFVRALKKGFAYRTLCWFGLVSMDIYVAQALMLKLAQGTAWGLIGQAFAAGVFLSLALSFFVLRRSRMLGALFLGMEWVRPDTVGSWVRARWAPVGLALLGWLQISLTSLSGRRMRTARAAPGTIQRLNRQEQ